MDYSIPIDRYKMSLAGLCSCCANMVTINEKMTNGEIVDETYLEKLCKHLSYCKEEFLSAKEELGFNDGLDFMQDAHFAGFSLEHGCIHGNTEKAYILLRPMRENFPETANNYQYEVATYLLAMLDMEASKHEVPAIQKPTPFWKGIIKQLEKQRRKIRCFLYS